MSAARFSLTASGGAEMSAAKKALRVIFSEALVGVREDARRRKVREMGGGMRDVSSGTVRM